MNEPIPNKHASDMAERQAIVLAFNAVIRRYPMHAAALRRAKRAVLKKTK